MTELVGAFIGGLLTGFVIGHFEAKARRKRAHVRGLGGYLN
jgi:hypothetical protein